MIIGIDLRPLQKDTRFRGIGIYLENLLLAISKLENDHSYVFYLEKGLDKPKIISQFPGSKIKYLRSNILGRIRFVRAFVPKNRIIHARRKDIDILFEADGELGAGRGVKSVLVFHDIIPMLFPDTSIIEKASGIHKLKRRLASYFYSRKYGWFLKQYSLATHIIAISKNSKKDLFKYVPGTRDTPTTVVYHGSAGLATAGVSRPKKVPEGTEFLLYVGGIDIRKNVVGLLEDFLEVKRTNPGLKLVVVGKEFGLTSQLRDFGWYDTLGNEKDAVIMPGFVSYEELAWLYKNAVVFTFPSRYEGFGMPVLEAMHAGCPVITYSNSSITEVAGNAALMIPDGKSLVQAINNIVSSPALRKKLIERGKKQAGKFTWQKSAEETLGVIQKTYEQKT